MLLWRSGLLRLILALSFMFSLAPAIGNSAGAAREMVEAQVSVASDNYDPNDTVTITIGLQNNGLRRMRADVFLTVVDPSGNLAHNRVWRNVRATTTIQLIDSFRLGGAPGQYTVGIEVSQSTRKATEIYLEDDAIASFSVTSVQQPTPTPTPEPTATAEPAPSPTAQPSPTPEATAQPAPSSVLFGVYPGGGNGELGYVESPAPATVIARLNELRGGQAFDIHLYTAWSWYNEQALRSEIEQYTAAGMYVTLTVKYSPPSGQAGDINAFVAFVEDVIETHASDALVHRIVIGNEINVVNGNPGSSDGPFAGVNEATIAGVLAARAKLDGMGRNGAQVGISLAVLERETDAQFLQGLASLGGDDFRNAVAFMGLNVYPGMWPVGTGDPYADMVTHLQNGRYTLTSAGFGGNVGLAVLENGFPTSDADVQLSKISGFLQAVCDAGEANGLSSYSWFDLWDANSGSTSPYAHYGLLRSDMAAKPSFGHYQNVIANGCGS